MNCHDARQHWNLFHDSEGDAELHFRINEHLSLCAKCAAWFQDQSHLERLLAARIADEKSDFNLWDQILTGSGAKQPTPRRRWRLLAAVGSMAALVLLAIVWFQFPRTSTRSVDLAQVSAGWHERLQSGQEPIPFTSNSDIEVEAYLKGRVPFPVRCPPRKDTGFLVSGAGVSQIEGRPTAFLNGNIDEVPVSIFVLPRDSLRAFPAQQAALRQYGILHAPAGPYAMVLREFDQNAIVVIGRAEPTVLERVINAYGSYPDHD